MPWRRPRKGEATDGPPGTAQAQREMGQYNEVSSMQPKGLYEMYASRPLYASYHHLGYVPATIDAPRPREEATAYIDARPRLQVPKERHSPVFELTEDEAEDRQLARKRRSPHGRRRGR